MNLADRITMSRIFLSPLFFIAYFVPVFSRPLTLAILWTLFIVIELSDLLDGAVARSTKSVSAFGKLFDPFADVIARMTYFTCFAFSSGGISSLSIMPLWAFLIIMYREFGILFLRMLLLVKGVTMGARPGGKAKAVTYMVSGVASLLYISLESVEAASAWLGTLHVVLSLVYVVAVTLSVVSFIDYLLQYIKITSKAD